ncbi:MAG: GTP 3',8-cyclase MoaA [Lachnotalea sp.]
MKDRWNRTINYLRISVTDQCNLRCCYCMPEEGISCLNQSEILTFKEIEEIVTAGVSIGIDTIKITGGEPLVRNNVTQLIKNLKNINGVKQVTLTTNGVLLKKYADELKEARVDSINVNFPALSREKYSSITRRDEFNQVMEGIKKAQEIGLHLKLNCVSRKTITDQDLYEYGMIAKQYPIDVRFIEMMPLGYGKMFETYSNEHILERIKNIFGDQIKHSNWTGNGPAVYYEMADFNGKIGFVSAVTHKFCNQCNRVRLSADGDLKLCLNYDTGVSLKNVLRYGDRTTLVDVMEQAIYVKPQQHCFYEEKDCKVEMKNMVQIGG